MRRVVQDVLQARPDAVLPMVAPDGTASDAIRVMGEHDVDAVLVMEGGRLVGLVTERDHARKVTLKGLSPYAVRIVDIMTRDVVTVSPSTTLDECRQLLAKNGFRHLPVVDGEQVVGLLSMPELW
ncbi:CBS domain-containing protein [Thermomonas sp.]|uniref:CBS domain-containing protein n=1 Tax=Thermomonas sp. TaxID=1971895 RepID=UPI00391A236A